MTDSTPRATICPNCRSLIPATMDDRRQHKEWHDDITSKHRGVQKRIGELHDVTARTTERLSDLRRDVDNTEIPEPVEPLSIEAWPDDEIDTLNDEDDEPYTASIIPTTPADDDTDDGPYFTTGAHTR